MGFNRTTGNTFLLIVQVEHPQREDGGDYYYRTYTPGIAMARKEGAYVINLTNVHRKKEEIMRQTARNYVIKERLHYQHAQEKIAFAAHSLFSEASLLEPHNYMPYLLGASYSSHTISWLQEAIERNPHSVKSWILLGEEYARKGDIVSAIKGFESASGIFPEYEICYLSSAPLL